MVPNADENQLRLCTCPERFARLPLACAATCPTAVPVGARLSRGARFDAPTRRHRLGGPGRGPRPLPVDRRRGDDRWERALAEVRDSMRRPGGTDWEGQAAARAHYRSGMASHVRCPPPGAVRRTPANEGTQINQDGRHAMVLNRFGGAWPRTSGVRRRVLSGEHRQTKGPRLIKMADMRCGGTGGNGVNGAIGGAGGDAGGSGNSGGNGGTGGDGVGGGTGGTGGNGVNGAIGGAGGDAGGSGNSGGNGGTGGDGRTAGEYRGDASGNSDRRTTPARMAGTTRTFWWLPANRC